MTDRWIAPDQIFDGQRLRTGKAVRISDDVVTNIADAPDTAIKIKGCLTPGFIDLQVNGGGGVMLNTTPTRDGMVQIATAHRQFGTIAILPTVITDTPDVLDQAADAAIAAKDDSSLLGLHIEGPHIALSRRGTHSADHIRPMDQRTIDVVTRLREHDIAVKVTVAPESCTNDQIAALSNLGAIVSIGHTDATAETVEACIAAGAACATHLFNAMSPMTSRAPGAVGAIINSNIPAGIICDGHHVDDAMIALALRARPTDDLMFLVSDAMATVGGPDHFSLYGHDIHVDNGRLINADGNLAGAHVTQAQGVARLVQQVGIPLEQALRMAITSPANLIGRPALSDIIGHAPRDLLVLSRDANVIQNLADVKMN